MGGNICKWCDWQGINLQNIETAHAAQYQKKKKKHNQKMGRRSKILQSTYIDGQETHEKMLNITNYQRNENQNYNEVSPYTSQNGNHQKIDKQ